MVQHLSCPPLKLDLVTIDPEENAAVQRMVATKQVIMKAESTQRIPPDPATACGENYTLQMDAEELRRSGSLGSTCESRVSTTVASGVRTQAGC